MNDYINYYDLLGINKNSTSDEIKKAYREQAKKWHPDLNKDPKAPEMAKKINEAKEILLNETKRKDYDNYLNNYKNGIYDKFEKKNENNNNNTSNKNNYEEKTYTKWEYFYLYLKYYKVNIIRKIIATILVIIESFICTLLDLINYIFAYIIAYFNYYLSTGFLIIGTSLSILLFIKNIVSIELPIIFNNTLLIIVLIFISFLMSLIVQILPNTLFNKVPILISKLNMKLFKISIGYK